MADLGRFEPRLKEDGSLDPNSLIESGAPAVGEWLRLRLSGTDAFFPIDARTDEDPASGLAQFIAHWGLGHPAAEMLAKAVATLLNDASKALPTVATFAAQLLYLLQLVAIPRTQRWFLNVLHAAVDHNPDRFGGWEHTGLGSQLLFAAVRQVPVVTYPRAKPAWEKLLVRADAAPIALSALSRNIEDRLHYLPRWFATVPQEDRDRDLSSLVFQGLTERGTSGLVEVLRARESNFSPDLRDAIDRACYVEFGQSAFRQPPPCGVGYLAIAGAGFRREYHKRGVV